MAAVKPVPQVVRTADKPDNARPLDRLLQGWTVADTVVTIAGDMTTPGFADGVAGAARFNAAFGITRDSRNGVLYVADQGNFAIRKVTPP